MLSRKPAAQKDSRSLLHPTSKSRKSVHDVAFRIGKGVFAEKEGAAAGTRHTNNFSKTFLLSFYQYTASY